ncbi:Coiled-coil domain containing protein 106 [Dissostichus eleginoides]|uniref:Coiled-coil domain containing protein 106 n=1 Tax=Dissostichus eleginoides TaxID=100907 RepID=A0AAD9BEY6_DISEL|nr:Coiled-coil domain containing protein 106 [Dissostichus eleginoides]
MPKAKKKNQVPKEESRMELIKEDLDGPEDTESLAPSCSTSLGSGSFSRLEFLEAKIEWQDKMIKDLEGERNFLREQVLGLKKKSRPAEVVHRYKKVLKTFGHVRTMSEAFRINNVDRGTIKMTAPIAELKIVDPDTFETLKFDPAIDTLLSFAKKCATNVSVDKKAKIEDMKAKGKLLPLLMKY